MMQRRLAHDGFRRHGVMTYPEAMAQLPAKFEILRKPLQGSDTEALQCGSIARATKIERDGQRALRIGWDGICVRIMRPCG